MTSPPARAPRADVRAVVDRVVWGVLPTAPAPSPTDLQALVDLDAGPPPRSWVDGSAHTLAALLVARSRLDALDEALAMIDVYFVEGRLRVSAVLQSSTRSALFAAVGEVYTAAGWPRRAGMYATQAIDFADDVPARYRAHAVRALSAALNGEYALAHESVALCRGWEQQAAWPLENRDYLLLLAEILIASAALDGPALETLAQHVDAGGADDPYWRYTARTARAMRALVERDYIGGMALLTTLTSGTESHRSHTMVRGFALGVLADTLLARGDVRRALAVLEGRSSPPGHALCFDMQRSAAYLALGRDRDVLEVTDGCLGMGAEHCVRTLSPLFLRRAVAHFRLGNHSAADACFAEGFHLAEGLGGSLTPYLTLPQAELVLLLGRLAERHPESADAVRRIAGRLDEVPTRDARPPLPNLSPREERLALLLRGPRNLPQIAEALGVSVNTVKSQLRSIYGKLEVSAREDAVAVLEANGFFV